MDADLDRVLGDERLTVLGLFAETWASLTARANAHLAGFGSAGAEFEVCLRLARSPEGLLRMSDLAAQTTLTSSGITRVVDRLVERGLVSRQSCATDRRTTYAVISETGRGLLDAGAPRAPGAGPGVGHGPAPRLRDGRGRLRGRAAGAARPRRAVRDRGQRRGVRAGAARPRPADRQAG